MLHKAPTVDGEEEWGQCVCVCVYACACARARGVCVGGSERDDVADGS